MSKSKEENTAKRVRRCRWCKEPLGAIVYKSPLGDMHPRCAEEAKKQLELDLAQM